MSTSYAFQMRVAIDPAADPALLRDLGRFVATANGQTDEDWETEHPLAEHASRLSDHLDTEYHPVMLGPFFDDNTAARVPGLDDAIGVRADAGTLLIGVEPSNFGRRADDTGRTGFDILFDFLAHLSADAPGTVCGRYWVEEAETAGPIVRTADGFVAAVSHASHPHNRDTGYSLGQTTREMIAPIVLPIESIRRDIGDGYLVRFDASIIRSVSTPAG